MPCIESYKFRCHRGKKRPLKFAKSLFVPRFTERRDVKMDCLPYAENDCLYKKMSSTALETLRSQDQVLMITATWFCDLLPNCQCG